MNRKTKIIATLGPAADTSKAIGKLILAGVNIFRFNMKHNLISWHEERINRVKKIEKEMKIPIGILIDLQGPEIRLETKDKKDIILNKGDHLLFTPFFLSDVNSVCIPQKVVFDALKVGDIFLVDDGFVEFKVTAKKEKSMIARVLEDAVLKNRKGVNLPGKTINLPSIIEDDLKKLDMAAANRKVDFIALSFSRTKKDIEILKSEMKRRKLKAKIIAKVESQPALDHLDELIEEADGIMVARGDLGIEVPFERLAVIQKEIISKCRQARKPVIVATQMLQSMVQSPRPTRAEATDVANAVFDGTDAVMLSSESALGNFPIKSVETMARICGFNENHIKSSWVTRQNFGQTEQIVHAAYSILTSQTNDFDAIVVFTETGYTAQVISSFRPNIPVIAVTDSKKTVEALTLSFGIIPVYANFPSGQFLSPDKLIKLVKTKGHLKSKQQIMVIHGLLWKKAGLTNTITIYKVD